MCLEEAAQQQQQTQQGADTEHGWAGGGGGVVLGTDAGLWSRDKAAEGAHKVELGTLVDLLIESLWKATGISRSRDDTLALTCIAYLIEENRGNTGQWLLETLCGFAGFAEQHAAICAVGTGLDVLPVVDVVLGGATLAGIHVIREVLACLHQAIDEVQRKRLAGVFNLIRVGLDVLNGAGMHLVAIALVGSMVAGKGHLGALRGELRMNEALLVGPQMLCVSLLTWDLPKGTNVISTCSRSSLFSAG